MKTCALCKTTKPLRDFHKNTRSKDGACSYCKPCAKAKVDEWKIANPDRRAANQSNYNRKNRSKIREAGQARRDADPDKYAKLNAGYRRKCRLKRQYGLTEDDLVSMIEKQGGRCAICHRAFSKDRPPVVDHCHREGHVRGALCNPCNLALGHVEKDGFLENALSYLRT